MTRKRPHRAVPAKRPKVPPAPPPVVTSAASGVALLQELVAQDIHALQTGKDKHGKRMTPTALRLLQRETMKTLKEIGELTGESSSMPEAKVVRLPAFRRVVTEVVTALERWPEALVAVGETLARLERGEAAQGGS